MRATLSTTSRVGARVAADAPIRLAGLRRRHGRRIARTRDGHRRRPCRRWIHHVSHPIPAPHCKQDHAAEPQVAHHESSLLTRERAARADLTVSIHFLGQPTPAPLRPRIFQPIDLYGRRLVHYGLCAVHRVLDPGLLLGLEERVVLERVVRHVALERHVVLESCIAAPQLEVLLNHCGEKRLGLDGHTFLLIDSHVGSQV